jgi:sterol desaturase/sphingolipid hydroxylase (fatty acid hydroxylase superfamily)
MHNPAGRWVEHRSAFRVLDAHHRLHHRLWRVNFNVVLPIADLAFGTLERREPDSTPGVGR